MPPRLTLLSTGRRSFSVIRHSQTSVSSSTSRRAIAIRSNACSHLPSARSLRSSSPSLVSLRHNSSKSDEKSIAGQNEGTEAKGPSQDALPAVSEEAAAFEKIAFEKSTGKKCDGSAPGSPELEQGTPVDEVRWSRNQYDFYDISKSHSKHFAAFRCFAVIKTHKNMLLVC